MRISQNHASRNRTSRWMPAAFAAASVVVWASSVAVGQPASFQGLGDLPGGGVFSIAHGISADGAVVVGRGNSASGDEAFRWTDGVGMVGLGDLPGVSFFSIASGISADGAVVVGIGDSTEAFRWTAGGGMVGLGDLPGGAFSSEAHATSADGAVVVGQSRSTSALTGEAFIWDATNGMRSLRDVLVNDHGLNLTGWTLDIANGISADGLTIVGDGINPSGDTEAWIATLPPPPDCNANGIPDATDIANMTSLDCNNNGIPDECEIDVNSMAPGGPFFCTMNCDPDCNNNGIPDECETGQSLVFDGVDDVARVASPTALPVGNAARTLEAWVYRESAALEQGIVVYGSPVNTQTFGLILSGDRLHFFGFNADVGNVAVIPLDIWMHVAVSWDGVSTLKLYVDGLLEFSGPPAPNTPLNTVLDANGLLMGARSDFPAAKWGGRIDEVRVWNVERTLVEIQATMNQRLTGSEPGLVGYWDFEETAGGQTIFDRSPSAQDGTLGFDGVAAADDPQRTQAAAPLSGEADCNANGIPDVCEPDCNNNGIPDSCEPFTDCNGDAIPDQCQLVGNDCNNNGIPDECEPDFDGDGLIDACDPDIDNDGVLNASDVCPFTPLGLTVRADGRPKGDMNDDCLVNALDIQLFIQQILNQ